MTSKQKRIFTQLCILAVTLLASLGVFTLSYRYDNKYTARTVQPIGGILFYSPDQGTVHLINGWEFYRGKLLSPKDWETDPPKPDGCLAFGQYPGMEAGDPDAAPHGSITYRLTVCLPDTPAYYTLELPEIYSAYRLYLNGRLAASEGNPDPDGYVPALKSGSLTFEGSGDVTLLLAVSDWSHLYSGLVYPPAFGPSGAVDTLLDQKFVQAMTAVVLALVLGLFQLILSALLKSRRSLYSGLICAAFAVSVSSPMIHRLTTTGIVPFYNLEIFCRYAIYGLAALLVRELCGGNRKERNQADGNLQVKNPADGNLQVKNRDVKGRVQTVITLLAAAFPFAALAVSFMAPKLSRDQMLLFSHAADIYKILCSLWLLGTVFHAGLYREQTLDTAVLLAGICAFASSLAADRLYPVFEPIRFGWFSETAGLIFVLFISFLMLRDSAVLYRKQFIFVQQKKQLETEIAMQKKHYMELAGQIETIRAMRHDIRHHLNQLAVLLDDGKAVLAKDYITRLTDSALAASPLSFCDAYSVDVLLRFYDAKAREQQIPFTVNVRLPTNPGIPEEDLCVILGNLLENGLEASRSVPPVSRQLTVTVNLERQALAIEVENTYTGERFPEGDGFRSTKGSGQHGIGLLSVRQTVEKYGGSVWIQTAPGEDGIHRFSAQVLLMAAE